MFTRYQERTPNFIPLGIQDSPQEDLKNTYNNLACTHLKRMADYKSLKRKYLSMQHSHESVISEN